VKPNGPMRITALRPASVVVDAVSHAVINGALRRQLRCVQRNITPSITL
jgi:hypothetical protein